MGVSISVTADAQKHGTQAFHEEDVLVPVHGEQETARLFGGEAQLVGFPQKKRVCPLE